jgi:muramoyltetrapeptide carboxypeptidase LdcA involved in peptidoglycan recycling
MGERGLLQQFPAILFARPKASSHDKPNTPDQKAAYARDQREAVLRVLSTYAPDAMVVFDVDFGHTDQLVVPYGGQARSDGPAKRIVVSY